jgi:CO dehydrogenase maturation factor
MSEQPTAVKRLVAVAGKGGTGKTASVAMMARVLAEHPATGRLLLIDADPAAGLLCALGAKAQRTMGEVREEVIRTAKGADHEAKVALADKVDYLVLEALTEVDGFAVLAMGRTETLGCYCPVNGVLRGAIASLSSSFDTIVIDGEAGLEQINRQVVRHLQTLLVLTDPTARGLETAAIIKKMVEVEHAVRCERLGLVFNRVRGEGSSLVAAADDIGMDVFGMIPFDENIAEYDLVGRPITELPDDSPSLVACRDLVERHVLQAASVE